MPATAHIGATIAHKHIGIGIHQYRSACRIHVIRTHLMRENRAQRFTPIGEIAALNEQIVQADFLLFWLLGCGAPGCAVFLRHAYSSAYFSRMRAAMPHESMPSMVQLRHLALLNKFVRNAKRARAAPAPAGLRQEPQNAFANAAFNGAFFGRAHELAFERGLANRLLVERLNPTHIDNAHGNAFLSKDIGGAFRLLHHATERENSHVGTFTRRARFALFKYLGHSGKLDAPALRRAANEE